MKSYIGFYLLFTFNARSALNVEFQLGSSLIVIGATGPE